MVQYEAFDSEVEVHGQTILAVIDEALARFSETYQTRARDALAANGVENPSPDEWYPQQAWLSTLEIIAEDLEPHLLDRLGEQIPEVVAWPATASGVEEGLQSINEAYQRNHRGNEIGYYRFEKTAEQTGEVTCANPYPCLFDRGLTRKVAQQHAPIEAFVFIEERGDECRRHGADTCTYTVHW